MFTMATRLSAAELHAPLAATGRQLRRRNYRQASFCPDNEVAMGADVGWCRKHTE